MCLVHSGGVRMCGFRLQATPVASVYYFFIPASLLGREGNTKSLSRIKLNCSWGKLRDFSGILSVQF